MTWAVVGVAGWLLANVAFVLGRVRCRDRARRAAGDRVAPAEDPAMRTDDAGGRPSLRLAAHGRGGR
ncbi:hypothetical protein [Patulibacter americanus]|uniref:hypothetical protein n=1 Tax=Patulibacter americanus TaxID=588672 RepID=UPI0003B371D7|nr:hypothetical protein [Patulibacter americanus]